MRDIDVRRIFWATEVERFKRDDPSTRVIDEFCILRGKCRVDLAVINSCLHGFEIKSAKDNLARLPLQQEHYGKVFDRMTLVADEGHVEEAVKIVPNWWGLISVSTRNGQPYLNEIWPSRTNFDVQPLAVAQLLWRDEALLILRAKGLGRGLSGKRRRYLWSALARQLPLAELRQSVLEALKGRVNWRQDGG